MRKLGKTIVLFLLLFMITACAEDENWYVVEDVQEREDVVEFLTDYNNMWTRSLEEHSFSMMEPFFVANSHVYHMQRRQHQQLLSERKVEEVVEVIDKEVEVSEAGEYKVTTNEEIQVRQVDQVEVQERARSYYVADSARGYRITLIERQD
ncbi:hypothetical protein LGQ02_08800 [Bacillus shivajii]|uniref:TcaA NTF2-like domain-containing protein n=1 Tax=Bacillus shivajii TaxID=1983719 RepID=UPI001CF979B7|nr:hypothetical protein [Bacillus shivajii]UCZ54825.1 hypothetical protein LGQ02_08800 [Bacillus shivajii]